jgi:hypothetical protein
LTLLVLTVGVVGLIVFPQFQRTREAAFREETK